MIRAPQTSVWRFPGGESSAEAEQKIRYPFESHLHRCIRETASCDRKSMRRWFLFRGCVRCHPDCRTGKWYRCLVQESTDCRDEYSRTADSPSALSGLQEWFDS